MKGKIEGRKDWRQRIGNEDGRVNNGKMEERKEKKKQQI